MERKSLILILLALCVLFILEEEVFHFEAFSTRPVTDNLTFSPSSPSSGNAGPLSVPKLRTVLFTRSPNHYEGRSGNNNNGESKGLMEGLDSLGPRRKVGGLRGLNGADTLNEESDDDVETDEGQEWDPVDAFIEDVERASLSDDEESWEEDAVGEDESLGDEKAVLNQMQSEDVDEEEKLRTSPYIYREVDDLRKRADAKKATETRYISFYLPWGRLEHKKQFSLCLYKNCAFVNNMSLADLVVFKASDIRDHVIPPFYRPKGQRWLMYTSDPAIKKYAFTREDVVSSFNWTMTYQLDADAPRIFGRLKKNPPSSRDYGLLFDNKARMAAWFVSHCITWSKREDYVQRMQTIMDLDIFGQCGNLTCGISHYRQNDRNLCLPMLTNEYKFYLSFENSFCPDYVTEKFFKMFQHVQAIPVVRGGFNYKRYLPSSIFVDAADFKTPEDLARYLVELGNDKKRYVDMLRWKDRWTYVPVERRHCRMCEHLNTHWNHNGYHSNLRHKFNGNPLSCRNPTDL